MNNLQICAPVYLRYANKLVMLLYSNNQSLPPLTNSYLTKANNSRNNTSKPSSYANKTNIFNSRYISSPEPSTTPSLKKNNDDFVSIDDSHDNSNHWLVGNFDTRAVKESKEVDDQEELSNSVSSSLSGNTILAPPTYI